LEQQVHPQIPLVLIPSSSGVASQGPVAIVPTPISSSGSIALVAYHTSQLMGTYLLDPNSRKLSLFLVFALGFCNKFVEA
jgi:hypothetical protein